MTNTQTDSPENYKFNKHEKLALIFALSPIILLFLISIVISTINGTFGNIECRHKQEYLNLEFNGIVKEKGLDRENHSSPYINIVSPKDKIKRIILNHRKSELWDKFEPNDYIIKQKGTLDFNITRDTLKFILTPTFNCGPDDFWIFSKK